MGLFSAERWAVLAEADALERAQELTGGGSQQPGGARQAQQPAQLQCIVPAVALDRRAGHLAPLAEVGALAARSLHQKVALGRKHFREHAAGGAAAHFRAVVGEPGLGAWPNLLLPASGMREGHASACICPPALCPSAHTLQTRCFFW